MCLAILFTFVHFFLKGVNLHHFCLNRIMDPIIERVMCFLCQKENIKIRDQATKLDSLGNFVPLYFSLTWTFLLSLLSGAVVVPENYVFQYFLKYGIGYWICLFSGYNSRRIYKIIHVHMLSHEKDYIQSYSAQIAVNVKNLCFFSLIQITIQNCNLYSNFLKLLKNRVF